MKYHDIFLNLRKRLFAIIYSDAMDELEPTPGMRSVMVAYDLLRKKNDFEFLSLVPLFRNIRETLAEELGSCDDHLILQAMILTIDEFFDLLSTVTYQPETSDISDDEDLIIDSDLIAEYKLMLPPEKLAPPPPIQAISPPTAQETRLKKIIKTNRAFISDALNDLFESFFIDEDSQFEKFIASQRNMFQFFSFNIHEVYLRNELKIAAEIYIKNPQGIIAHQDDDQPTTTYDALMATIAKGKNSQPADLADKKCLYSLLTKFELKIETLHTQWQLLDEISVKSPTPYSI